MGAMTATTGSPDEPPRVARPDAHRVRSNSGAPAARPTISAALAIETSFGYALGLELDHELVLLHLQPSLEVLVAYADRIEAALLAQGWQRLDTRPLTHEGARMTPTDPVRSTSDTPRRRLAWRRVLLLALGAIVLVPASSYAQAAARPGRTPSPC